MNADGMSADGINRSARIAAHAALWVFVASAVLFGAQSGAVSSGFSHRTHPLAWLGADGMPAATAFNLSGFVLAGLLAAVALWSLRSTLPTGTRWSARIGAQLAMLSALAFAAQGLLPLDPEDPDGAASAAHGLVWTLWWLTFAASGLALAAGLRGVQGLRRGFVAATAAAGLAIPAFALFAPLWVPNALAQRAAFVLWFVWVAWAAGARSAKATLQKSALLRHMDVPPANQSRK
jgi:hypothetical membrane protein